MDAKRSGPGRRRVLLVRYHDGAARPNWGGRATSLALAGIIDRRPDAKVADVVNGIWLTRGFDGPVDPEFPGLLAHLRGGARLARMITLAQTRKPYDEAPIFDAPPLRRAEELLADRAKLPELDAIVDQIRACDIVVVNGEGDFILSRRRSLWRCLLIMELAALAGRPVHLVNTMLSRGPDGETDEAVVTAVGGVLERAASVSWRDRESLRLSRLLFPELPATFHPDALFVWRGEVRRIASDEAAGPFGERLSPTVLRALRSPYVAVSGGSLKRPDAGRKATKSRLLGVLEGLRSAGCAPVVVATCAGDAWMLRAAEEIGAPVVPADVPLAAGANVLGRAQAFLSGRYHPSILASLAGTPCVFMRSNSHKTRSLPELLESSQTQDLPFFNEDQSTEQIVEAAVAAVSGAAAERVRVRRVVDSLATMTEQTPLPA